MVAPNQHEMRNGLLRCVRASVWSRMPRIEAID
jgi:hypothetical protein